MRIVVRSNQQPQANFDQISEEIGRRQYPRAELKKILTDYNAEIGNDAQVQEIDRCVVTGQQLGMLGGPTYTILKAISCLQWAKKLNATPIFWLATEDHDVDEVDHTYLIDQKGNLKKYHLPLPKEGHFVEDLQINNDEAIRTFFHDLGREPPVAPSSSYRQLMASYLVHLFKGTGLLFVEPYLLRSLAKPFFEERLQREDPGLFYKEEGGRREKVTATVPLEQLSTNVYTRPLLQSVIIPTLAYIAGPNERRYYQTLDKEHRSHQIPFPALIGRMHATMIEPSLATLLEKLHLEPWEELPKTWEEVEPFSSLTFEGKKRSDRKNQLKEIVEKEGYDFSLLHRLHNSLRPKDTPQERVLNWFGFKEENLIQKLLKEVPVGESQQVYCYL